MSLLHCNVDTARRTLTTPIELERAFEAASPRFAGQGTAPRANWRSAWPSLLIHGGAATLFVVLITRAFVADNLFAWSAGLVYVLYDTLLIALVFTQTLPILTEKAPSAPLPGEAAAGRPRLGVLVAAHNEAAVLSITLRALLTQTDTPDLVLVADDGSRDDTAAVLLREFGLQPPPLGTLGAPGAAYPTLRWLRLPHGGKARALNAALLAVDTELVVTVDGDTLLDSGAVAAIRAAFVAQPSLVAVTGVLTPVCGPTLAGRFFETFQTYEYIRNFLSRYAWAQMDALLLVSGAFAGFRREAALAVGGFDPGCMTEDYELIHRLRLVGADRGLGWTTGVVGGARAITDAPATAAAFLRQRRRWFCGFLQTQFWYRDMVGARRYGRLGMVMLPIKALDTLQPIYGLAAFALLLAYLLTGRLALLLPVGGVIAGKIAVDFAFHLWSVHLYRRWVDPTSRARLGQALLASLIEPFTFQILRHVGAALGWASFLTRSKAWGRQTRVGLLAVRDRGTS